MTTPLVTYTVDGRVGIVTLNRPEKLNAITPELKRLLIERFHEADRDPATNVVVLRAEGRGFCAGYDIAPSPPAAARRGTARPWPEPLADDEALEMTPRDMKKPAGASGQGHSPGGAARHHAGDHGGPGRGALWERDPGRPGRAGARLRGGGRDRDEVRRDPREGGARRGTQVARGPVRRITFAPAGARGSGALGLPPVPDDASRTDRLERGPLRRRTRWPELPVTSSRSFSLLRC